MKKEDSVFRNTIIYTIKLFVAFFFPLVSQPYVNRILGVTQIGKYNFSNSIVSYFASFAGLGISTYAIREGSKLREDRKKIEKFSQEMLSINIISMTASLLILFFFITINKNLYEYKNIIILLSLEIPLVAFGTNWIFNIYEDYVYVTIRNIIFQIIAILFMFLLVKSEQDIYWYSIISVIASYGSNVLNLFYSKKYYRFQFIINKNLLVHIRPILILFASSIASQVYLNLDITMLGIIGDDHQVGIYSAATKIYSLARMTLSAFVTVMVPRIAACSLNKRKYIKVYLNAHNAFLTLVIPVSFGLLGTSGFWIKVFCGEAFKDAIMPLNILCIALLFSSLGSFIANLVLLINKEEKKILLATVVGAIVNFIGNMIVLPFWGCIGAAMTTLLSESVVFLIQYGYSKKYIIASLKEALETIKIIISAFLIPIICSLVDKIQLGIYSVFGLKVIACLVGYGFFLMVFGNRTVKLLVYKIGNMKKKGR